MTALYGAAALVLAIYRSKRSVELDAMQELKG